MNKLFLLLSALSFSQLSFSQIFEYVEDGYGSNSSSCFVSKIDIDQDNDDDLIAFNDFEKNEACIYVNDLGSFTKSSTCFSIDSLNGRHSGIFFNNDTLIDIFTDKGVFINTGDLTFDFEPIENIKNYKNETFHFKAIHKNVSGKINILSKDSLNFNLYTQSENFDFEVVNLNLSINQNHLTADFFELVDFNLDGLVDICIENDGLTLFKNMGNNEFTPLNLSEIIKFDSKSILNFPDYSWIDYDNDGDLDLYVNKYFDYNRLYQNNTTDFISISAGSVTNETRSTTGHTWKDVNNDGLADLFISRIRDKSQLYIQNENNTFSESNNQPMEDYSSYGNCVLLDLTSNSIGLITAGRFYKVENIITSSIKMDLYFEIFPNPSSGNINIKTLENTQNSTLNIYQLNGNLIKSIELKTSKTKLNLDKGFYLYQLTTKNHYLQSGKIIIQ